MFDEIQALAQALDTHRKDLLKSGSVKIYTGNAPSEPSGSITLQTGKNIEAKLEKLNSTLDSQIKSNQRIAEKLSPPSFKERVKRITYNIVRYLP